MLDRVRDHVGTTPYMHYGQALKLDALLTANNLRECLELGFKHGVSSAYIAATIKKNGSGHLTTVDLCSARGLRPSIEQLLAALDLQDIVTVHYETSSYTWRLMKLLEQHSEPAFDFCFINGGFTWDAAGYAVLLVERLLKPGGWLVLSNLDWTYEALSRPTGNPSWLAQKSKEEMVTPQVRKVWDLLVRRNPAFDECRQEANWAYARKVRQSSKNGWRADATIMQSACGICGNREFTIGPNGRRSPTGKLPQCTSCSSVERHRIGRHIFLQLRDEPFSECSVLQFSKDRTVDPSWFGTFELSVFGKENSLDLQNIERPSDSYDVVICIHVLEHVPDDVRALQELYRLIRGNGFVFLSVPDPVRCVTTRDWGFPDAKQHGHYRVYGRDIRSLFKRAIPDACVVSVSATDDVTGTPDLVYLICKSAERAGQLVRSLAHINIVQANSLIGLHAKD